MFGSCRRFDRLSLEARDRELSPAEETFLKHHRATCAKCAESESTLYQALGALSGMDTTQTPQPAFENRLFRKLHIELTKASVRYWTPALIAACVMAAIVLAALQVATFNKRPSEFKPGDSEVRRITASPILPDLENNASQPAAR